MIAVFQVGLPQGCGCSNESCVFLDSTGRAYTVVPQALPSTRSRDEPLTGRVTPFSDATFKGVLISDVVMKVLIASDAGCGFAAWLGDLHSKNRSGKTELILPKEADILAPQPIASDEWTWMAVLSGEVRLLVFLLEQVPELLAAKVTRC